MCVPDGGPHLATEFSGWLVEKVFEDMEVVEVSALVLLCRMIGVDDVTLGITFIHLLVIVGVVEFVFTG